jgi:uncharacterized protein
MYGLCLVGLDKEIFMLQTLQRIILEKQELLRNRELFQRELHIPQTKQIKILSGPRRCGKTCLMQLNARNYPIEHVLYLDFEDERLVELSNHSNYDIILDSYHSIYPTFEPVIFFDEIQALPNWHLFIKRLYERYPAIWLTGSNANLLSRDIATYLTGRAVVLPVRPLTFKEFIQFKQVAFDSKSLKVNPAKWLNLFNEFRQYGGFPEVVSSTDKATILQGIFQLILYKDLASKLGYSDYALRLIIGKLAENVGKSYSMNSLYHKITQFYPFSRTTCNDYIQSLEQPYLTQTIKLWRKSFVQRESERKTYFIDNGFITLHSVGMDYGKLLENCVALELMKRYEEVYYYRTTKRLEVDFIVFEPSSDKPSLFQVCESLSSSDTYKREVNALFQAIHDHNLNTGVIITSFDEKNITQDDMTISVIPVWKWMLKQ